MKSRSNIKPGNLILETCNIRNNIIKKFLITGWILCFTNDTINALFVRMKSIEAKFKTGYKKNDNACTYSQGKSKNINNGIRLVAKYVSPSDFEIIFKHKKVVSDVGFAKANFTQTGRLFIM